MPIPKGPGPDNNDIIRALPEEIANLLITPEGLKRVAGVIG